QVQVQTQTQTKPEPVDVEPEEPDASEVGEDVELERQEAEETNTSLPVSGTPMVVTIGSGDGSYAVSKKLADVGAISSPGNFDTFLCENGYDKKIRPGTYTIPADASDEQMARIITGAE
ncbi:MAG: endolytic transglycosylase MltG, partial [Lachnospiraceae bacterium]|nr:endolytic transglycosylase MltG [Lachnospiraceae bacterium]